VDFRILGPLEVVGDDGRELSLTGAKQRGLLAILLLHANEPVSSDRLIEELWGDRAPASAAKAVHVHISRLRRVLGDGAAEEARVLTRGGGYVLRLGPGECDRERAQQLVEEGTRALGDGSAERATARFEAALALWRGEPLADMAYESFVQREVLALEELRLVAVEGRIDAELALGHHGQVIPELERLIERHPHRERLAGLLMLSLYRAGRQADALAVYRKTSGLLREQLGLEPGRHLQELERSILEHDASLDGVWNATASRNVSWGVCPFKGLAFFDRADVEYFCGRERLVSELLARLVESPLVGILGPSGIGKSSLLRAGVLPALSAGALPGSSGWRQVLLRPGARPGAELGRAFDGDRIGRALGQLSSGERVVVAVDQLEELFTLCEHEDERSAFLDQLAEAARDPDRRAVMVLALRADFYGRFASYPRFAELLSASHVLVGAMDREELGRAIEEPAARAGLGVERPLVEALVADVAGEPGGLPLLSTTLLELWRGRDGGMLRYETYRRSGGVRGAVARLAETAYAQLGESERRIARGVMLRLASGDGGALARRRVPLSELRRINGAGSVLAELTEARLLTVGDGEVELSHEALLREWPRYRTWLEEDRIGRRVHAHLTAAANDWDARDRDPGELYRGARLASALDWAAQHDDQLNALEREFIQSSRVESERVARRQRAQNRRLRGLLIGVGVLSVFAVIAGVVALVQRQSARHQASAATTAARVALARQLGAQAVNEPRLDRATSLAREAVNLDRSPQTEGSLLATLQRSPAVIGTLALPINGPPQQLAVSPDGHTVAVGALRPDAFNLYQFGHLAPGVSLGDLRLYDARTHQVKGQRLTDFGGAGAPVYSRDGSLLVYPTGGIPPSIAVRDARTLRLVRRLALDPLQLASYAPDLTHARILIAPDGHTLYCAYQDFSNGNYAPSGTYLARWSLPSGRLLSTTRIGGAAVLAMGLTGAHVVVVDARSAGAFDARSSRRLSTVAIAPALAAPSAATISPDGRIIAIGSQAGGVSFVDLARGGARAGIGAHIGTVASFAYSPDGRAVASAANDTVVIWNPRSATPREVLTVPGGQVQSVTFGAGGRTLYTSTVGGLVLAWDVTGERSFGRRVALSAASFCCNPAAPLAPPLAVSPDGTTFAVRLGTSTVGLFSAQTLQSRGSFTVKPKGAVITALAWSRAAPELAVGGSSGLIQLWRTDGTPRFARSLSGLQPVLGQPEAIQGVAFSRDGRLIAASDTNETWAPSGPESDRLSTLAIWRTSTGNLTAAPLALGSGPARFDPLAFSPDSRLVAVSAPDGRVLVVDATTAQIRQTLHPIGGDFTGSLAFAPDGTLATGTLSGIVQRWNPISRAQVAAPLPVTAGPVSSIAFEPSGRRFVTTATRDGAVKLFATSTLQQEGTTLNTDRRAASTAAFTPHDNGLLVVTDRGNGFTWPMSLEAWEQRACTVAGRNLTRGEWARFVSGHAYAKVCP
jgi:DNA-binding SARP family transcriptional activator/WD40 repeat protein